MSVWRKLFRAVVGNRFCAVVGHDVGQSLGLRSISCHRCGEIVR